MSDAPSFGETINRTARLLRRLADDRLAPLGLSAGYLPVVTALMRGAALSQKALTERAGIEQPTMAATLGRMERDGIIARAADPGDRRSVRFSLTAGTRAKTDAIAAAIQALSDAALARLPPADRARLGGMLNEVIAAVEAVLAEGER